MPSKLQVEKIHANIQVLCRSDHCHAPRQKTVQINSYVMGAQHQHAALKNAVEAEIMGDNRNSIFRLLAARVVESSAPTQLSLRNVSKKHLKPPRLLNSGNAGCLGCIGHRGSVQTVCFTHPVELQEFF